jgi:para-nitrobenzyl esterase
VRDPSRRAGPERNEPRFSPEQAAEIIDGADAMHLQKAGNRLLGFTRNARLSDPMPFAPTVDGEFLPQAPVAAALAGKTHRVPLMTGSNRDEGELFARFWSILPDTTQLLVGVHDPEVHEELNRLYPGTRDEVRLAADAVFWVPTAIFAENHAKHSPTYFYRYDYAPRPLKLSGIGATHATDLFAVFGIYRHPIGVGLALAGSWISTRRITSTMQSLWTWFARTGVPSESWPRYTEDDRRVMILDHPTRVEHDPDGARRAAWERIHLQLRRE